LLPSSSKSYPRSWHTSLTSPCSFPVIGSLLLCATVRHHHRPLGTASPGLRPLLPPRLGATPRSSGAHEPHQRTPLPLLQAVAIVEPPASATAHHRSSRARVGVSGPHHSVRHHLLSLLSLIVPSPASRNSLWQARRRTPLCPPSLSAGPSGTSEQAVTGPRSRSCVKRVRSSAARSMCPYAWHQSIDRILFQISIFDLNPRNCSKLLKSIENDLELAKMQTKVHLNPFNEIYAVGWSNLFFFT
jgi:hypothetical protein